MRWLEVPKVSEFFGISIYVYAGDHEPPHFHARYAEFMASIAIADLSVLRGSLPRRAMRLLREWALLHRPELLDAWLEAQHHQRVGKIAPLE